MFIDSEIRQAIEFESDSEHPVLSVYLNVDPHRRSAEKYKLARRNLLGKAKDADPQDVQRMQNYVEMGYNWQGRGLVMFACAAKDFWWARSFMVPVTDSVFTNFRPYVRQRQADRHLRTLRRDPRRFRRRPPLHLQHGHPRSGGRLPGRRGEAAQGRRLGASSLPAPRIRRRPRQPAGCRRDRRGVLSQARHPPPDPRRHRTQRRPLPGAAQPSPALDGHRPAFGQRQRVALHHQRKGARRDPHGSRRRSQSDGRNRCHHGAQERQRRRRPARYANRRPGRPRQACRRPLRLRAACLSLRRQRLHRARTV